MATTDQLNVDSNTLYVDATNNRVGVNTANPGSTLEINGATQVTGNALTVSDAGFNSRINLFNTGSGGSNFSLYSTMSSFAQGSNTFMLYSPNATSGILKAHEDGYVHMPYQPAFSAFMNSTVNFNTMTDGDTIPFASTNLNVGNHYNTSTYTFTAPVSGTYEFSCYLRLDNINSAAGDYFHPYWSKNGAGGIDGITARMITTAATLNIFSFLSSTVMCNMSANDTMRLRHGDSQSSGSNGASAYYQNSQCWWVGKLVG